MKTSNQRPLHASRRAILAGTAGATGLGLLILFAAVLPAEFHRDPTGLGRLTGISALWAPAETNIDPAMLERQTTRTYDVPFRSDTIEIPLATGDDRDGRNELEYKVRVAKGGSFVYSWSVAGVGDPQEFYSEFHGHTLDNGKTMTVAEYRKASGTSGNGMLVAPFAGIHGWYFQNQALPAARVTLRLAGFYSLIEPGDPGNERGITPGSAPAD